MTDVPGTFPLRGKVLLGLLFLGILTLWVPGYAPVAMFLVSVFSLTLFELSRARRAISQWKPLLVLSLLAALPIWGMVQLLRGITVYAHPTKIGILGILAYACVAYLILGLPSGTAGAGRSAMLWFAFAVAIEAILQHATGGRIFWLFAYPPGHPIVMGPILYHNHWAAFVELTLPLAIYQAMRSRTGPAWVYAVMAAVLYASVVASASRSGVIICTVEVLLTPLLAARGGGLPRHSRTAVISVLAISALVVWIAGTDLVIARFLLPESIAAGREDFNRNSATMLAENRWLGVGLGNWPITYPHYADTDDGTFVNEAHNDWMQWAVEGGLLYGFLYVGLAAICCFQAWRFPWVIGCVAFLGQALVDFPFSRPVLACWFWALLALSMIEARLRGSAKT